MKNLNRLTLAVLTAGLGIWSMNYAEGAHDQHGAEAAIVSDTITGEVVDLACYLGHGAKGKDHAKCAKQCVQKGLPVGLLTEQGDLFLAVGADHSKANELLAPNASKTVSVVGKKTEGSGMKMIEVHQVLKSNAAATSAPAAPIAKSEFICPMHSDVHQAGPGKCPKCGMALEKTK